MKKLMLCLVLTSGLLILGSTSSWALVHDAIYHWRDGGTTVVDETDLSNVIVYNIGNPTGDDYIQVFEKVQDLGEGMGKFRWNVVNDTIVDDIYSFHVQGQGFRPFEVEIPDGWEFAFYGGDYYWWTEDPDYAMSGFLASRTFWVVTNTTEWDISRAWIDTWNEEDGVEFWRGNGLWVASHPTPEPSTMALLGLGLIGFGRRLRRKRFKA